MALDPVPSSQTPAAGLAPALKVPLSPEDAAAWRRRLDASAKVAKEKREAWKSLVAAYMTKVLSEKPREATAVIPLEFAYVELKKSQLAFQVPEITLEPRLPGLEQAVVTFQDGLNHLLGPEGANCDALLDEIVTDVLLCGVGFSVIGYWADIRTRQVPVMEPEPNAYGEPMVDPATGQPAMRQARDPFTGALKTQPENYVLEECYEWDRLPPELGRIPVEFEGSDFDQAAWLGYRFRMNLATGIQRFKLPADFTPTVTAPRDTLSSDEQPDRGGVTLKEIEGDVVWYRTAIFDGKANAQKHALRRLVLIDNHPEPVVHEDSPYQYVDETDGKLKGMLRYPIRPLTIRFLPGSAYPMSDVEVTRPIADEERLFRSQQIQFRDRSMPFVGVDITRMSPDDKAKIEKNLWKPNPIHGFNGPVNEAVGVVHLGAYPRENVEFGRECRRDYELGWSMRSSATGQLEEGEPPTATEVNAAEGATRDRLAKEQLKLLKWWCAGVETFASLPLQFMDEPRFAMITGPDGVKKLTAWNRTMVQGEYAYKARPDSALRLDVEAEWRMDLATYNQLGNDPNFNRAAYLKDMLTRRGKDASKYLVEQLPEKKPEPPKVSMSVKGEDLSIANPQFPLIISLLQQGGFVIDPTTIENAKLILEQMAGLQMVQQAQAAQSGEKNDVHGGATTPANPLNKHAQERNLAAGPGGTVM